MTHQDNNKTPSTVAKPDLDWSQVRETVRMLELSAAQVNMAMKQGDDSIDALSNSFTSMIHSVNNISTTLENVEFSEEAKEGKQTIRDNCTQVKDRMNSAIIAFQFYDRLSQQLAHVVRSLDSMSELIGDQSRLYNPVEWKVFQATIRERYTMQEEQEMFDALLQGATIEEALAICDNKMTSRDEENVELF